MKSIDALRDAQVIAINKALDQGRLDEADALDDTLEILNELAVDQFFGKFQEPGARIRVLAPTEIVYEP